MIIYLWHKVGLFLFFAIISGFCASADFRIDLARKLVSDGKLEAAIQEYKIYLGENPKSAKVYEELGKVRSRQNKFKLAIYNFQTAIKLDPELIESQEGLAYSYEKSGEKEKAIIEWRKLATISRSSFLKNRAEKHIANLLLEIKGVKTAQKPEIADKKVSDNNIILPLKRDEANSVLSNKNTTKDSSKSRNPKVAEVKEPQNDSIKKAATEIVQKQPAEVENNENNKQTSASSKSDIYSQTNYLKAVSLYKKNKYPEALTEIKKALSAQPGHPGAYYYAGVIRYENKQYDQAIINFRNSFAFPEKGFNAHFYLGRIYQKQQKVADAIKEYQSYISLTSSKSGIEDAERYIKQLSNGDSDIKAEVAQVVSFPKKPSGPVVVFFVGEGERIFSADTSTPEGQQTFKGVQLIWDDLFEQALRLFQQISLNYGSTREADYTILNLSTIYLKLKLYEKARKQANSFLALPLKMEEGINSQAKLNMAMANVGNQNWDESLRILKQVKANLVRGPTSQDINRCYASYWESRGDLPKAVSYYQKIRDNAENRRLKSKIDFHIANLWNKNKQSQKAFIHYDKLLAYCPDSSLEDLCPVSRISAGDILYKQKKWNAALDEYNKFLKDYNNHKEAAWCLYQVANILKKKGKYKSALVNYREVIEKYPNSYWAEQAKWKQEDAAWRKEYEEVFN